MRMSDDLGKTSLRALSERLIREKISFGGPMAGMAGARKILIIDDEPTIADTLAVIFSSLTSFF